MTTSRFVFISLIFTSSCSLAQVGNVAQPEPARAVDFFQEEITLTLTDSTLHIDGTYHFRNNTLKDIPLPIVFPFHVDSVTAYPHRIEAYIIADDGTKRTLKFSEIRKAGAARIRIPIEANGDAVWQLVYEQKISSKRAVYIITSTGAWGKPLNQATYIFVTPDDFEIGYIWPEPDSTYKTDGLTYRQCVKHDFMPAREMEIIWK